MTDVAFDPNAKNFWGIIARDKRNNNVRWFPITFGFAPTAEEAIMRVKRQLLNDFNFREKYRGWVFSPFLADLCIEVNPNGAVLLHKNHQEAISR